MWQMQKGKLNQEDIDRFRALLPISELTATGFAKVVQIANASTIPAGEQLFRQGDDDPFSVFLLHGQVGLTGQEKRFAVKAGTEAARYALASLKPRKFTGRALTQARIAHVESDLLGKVAAWDQMSKGAAQGVEVEELNCGDDPEWFLEMLGNSIFMKIPTANVEALVARFEPVPVKAGQTIIEQGEEGHDYFIIRSGRCEVLRTSHTQAAPVKIAERHAGEGVGEEGLISNKPRDATVRMLDDGLVMRLSKSDFDPLMKEPLMNWVDEQEAASCLEKGAVPIDVRLEDEFKHGTLAGAMNIPLYLFRLKADLLDRSRHYIVFCDTGQRSATAAFLLGIRGIQSSVIRGGIDSCTALSLTA